MERIKSAFNLIHPSNSFCALGLDDYSGSSFRHQKCKGRHLSLILFFMRVGEHRRGKIAGRERREEDTFSMTVQQHKSHFRIARFLGKILGTFFEEVFWERFSRRRKEILAMKFRKIMYSPYSGNENRGSMYGTTVSMDIEVVCTVSLA